MASLADEVVIGLSSHTKNLPLETREALLQKLLADYDFMNVKFKVTHGHQPFEVFERIDQLTPGDALAVFGEDQASLASSCKRALNWNTKLIDRLTSSTAIRAHIDAEEWDCLARLVLGHILRDVINLRILEKTNG